MCDSGWFYMADLTPRRSGWRRKFLPAAVIAAALIGAWFGYAAVRDYALGRALIIATPDSIPSNARLVRYAEEIGRNAYVANCASCHGADMKGSQTKGIPNLSDGIWLYDYGRVSDIERTILYGIRAGLGKSHNVT